MSRPLILAALAVLVIAIIAAVAAAKKPPGDDPGSLYNRLGGAFAIAGVVDHFSDAVLRSPVVGANSPNPALREWSRAQSAARLPGLKFLRTLWVCDVAGGPQRYAGTKPGAARLGLENAHRHLRITPAEFDEVARLLAASLDHARAPPPEKAEVLAAFAAHKAEVVAAGHN